jgi:hypothetical protein
MKIYFHVISIIGLLVAAYCIYGAWYKNFAKSYYDKVVGFFPLFSKIFKYDPHFPLIYKIVTISSFILVLIMYIIIIIYVLPDL